MAERVHINPRTGNPGRCDATVACPFGMALDRHFESFQEARAAYEQANRSRLISTWDATTVDPQEEEAYMVTLEAHSVMSHFVNREGSFTPPAHDEPTFLEAETEYDGFTSLGGGNESNVYLNPNERRVVKVPNSFLSGEAGGWSPKRQREHERRMAQQQEAYRRLEEAGLAAEGVEYVPTTYTPVALPDGSTVTVVSQPYLSPEAYRDPTPEEDPLAFSLTAEPTPLARRLTQAGVHDTPGNFKVRRSDGHLVLFDAL